MPKFLPANRATLTGLEPATSAVTGRRANQLRYRAMLRAGACVLLLRSGAACPQRGSNPCYRLERAASWTARRWGLVFAGGSENSTCSAQRPDAGGPCPSPRPPERSTGGAPDGGDHGPVAAPTGVSPRVVCISSMINGRGAAGRVGAGCDTGGVLAGAATRGCHAQRVIRRAAVC